jgi:hypothetical protein
MIENPMFWGAALFIWVFFISLLDEVVVPLWPKKKVVNYEENRT